MIESFNHYTLNTGDSRRSHPREVDKNMYLVLKGFIRDSQKKEFVDLFDGVQFKLTMTERRSYVCTLFKTIKGQHTPFLITFGCCDKEDYSYMLEQLQNFYERFNHEKPKVIPSLPFVADMIMPAALFCMKELEWTGDFCRCMGWAVLSPESIRP